jgi:hypothetical protein
MPRTISAQGGRGISLGHMYFTNATSGYMLENEKKVTISRASFRENKYTYKHSDNPILGIKSEDQLYLVKFSEKETEIGR